MAELELEDDCDDSGADDEPFWLEPFGWFEDTLEPDRLLILIRRLLKVKSESD